MFSEYSRWRLGGFEIARPCERHAAASLARAFVGQALTDPLGRQRATEIVGRLRGGLPAHLQRAGDGEFLSFLEHRLAAALRCGELVLIGTLQRGGGRAGGLAFKPAERVDTTARTARRRETTWVEIDVVDREDRPVSGRRYRLKLTDGSVREGTLGDDGRIRVSGIDPGDCEITFLDLDQGEIQPV